MLRVAFVGKGGSGKSAVAGTFARLLGRRGAPVLAIDSDPLPGLALSLGLGPLEHAIPEHAVEPVQEGDRTVYRLVGDAVQAVDAYAVEAADNVRFLQFGKLRGPVGPLIRAQQAFRQILDGLPADRWHVVGDLPGGTRQPFFGWARYARTVVVVVEPTAKSLMSARRLSRLALAKDAPERIVAVANKVRDDGDLERVRAGVPFEVVAAIPFDEQLAEAERRSAAPLDLAPAAPAVRAVESLLDALAEEVTA